jgi:hypothetical protein
VLVGAVPRRGYTYPVLSLEHVKPNIMSVMPKSKVEVARKARTAGRAGHDLSRG